MYHPAPAVKRDDFGHVETHRLVALMGALEIRCGGCDDTALLGGVDRRSGGIQRAFGAGLYLAEHQCSVRFSQDEVYLPHPGVIVVGDEGRTLLLVETRGGCLSPAACPGPVHPLPSGQ